MSKIKIKTKCKKLAELYNYVMRNLDSIDKWIEFTILFDTLLETSLSPEDYTEWLHYLATHTCRND